MAAAKSNEIKITRIYDAPVSLVWDAWTDPKKAAKWWGPRGFTITTHSKNLRPGGTWHYTMHGSDGVDYPNMTVYHEVEKYARLVYDHGGYADRPPLFRVTVNFEEKKGKTHMDMTMALATPEAAAEIKKFIKQAGGNATWDRLAEYLDHETEGKDPFVINRSFAAPIATVFEMWTNPKHFSQWLPPTGMTMETLSADVKPGGSLFFLMTNGDFTMYGRLRYTEISPVHRLAYTQEFSDKDGNKIRNPMSETWPETMVILVTFTEEEDNHTRVTVRSEASANSTPEEVAAFVEARGSMTMGWSGSFDKLDDIL